MSFSNVKNLASFKDLKAVMTAPQSYVSTPKQGGEKFIIDLKSSTQLVLDRFAMGLSALCAVHCLAAPVLLVMFPSLLASLQLDDHIFHELLVWLAVPTSIVAIFLGCKRHKDRRVLALAAIGIVSLIFTAFYGHDAFGETGEKIATLFAVSVLASAHWRNYSLCRHDSCEH